MQLENQARLRFREGLEAERDSRFKASSLTGLATLTRLASEAAPITVVLVEGISDQSAVTTLLERHSTSQQLAESLVLSMGGATNIGHFFRLLGPAGLDLRLAGLFDRAEAGFFQRALGLTTTAQKGPETSPAALPALPEITGTTALTALTEHGFFACQDDLEAELIRALGAARVLQLIEREGDLRSWLSFRNQPAQRERPEAKQLQRFMGTTSGRKEHYAVVLSEALAEPIIPQPLRALLDFL
ncbi:TOPRIM nucleotidyl transferase/hydrolase domain-containing protein [Psychromicrobium lacuslunae]|uniref:OLD protein-like TOPRIM domain-containing protein n=1 Tax=Psychromicrobium lacuslunae TaxID=1618207 RepID=A0A0D4BY85_9MICC|nr:TOPRIM nucleotidyl transferase/hydrolase domain-containing protein [Psychromicrobium lacuslunae]AJT41051.1 hypothetical protein UM93_05100 [Psychromicrobium lacuslunae]